MVLRWSTFKIVSGDPDFHLRWPTLAGMVVTSNSMRKMFKKFSPLKPLSKFKANMAYECSMGCQFLKNMSGD